jgi:bacterioferritin
MKRLYLLIIIVVISGLGFFFFSKKSCLFNTMQSAKSNKNNEQLILQLNKALADEWLAYYQYWIGAHVITGAMKSEIIKELDEHANDELRHATMIAKRIIQLGGTPLLEPKAWYSHTGCGYLVPKDFQEQKILSQNIDGEQCAIRFYSKLLNSLKNSDSATYKMLKEILRDEIEHEKDLQKLFGKIK